MKLPKDKLIFLLLLSFSSTVCIAQLNAIINSNQYQCEVAKNGSLNVIRSIEITVLNHIGAEMISIPVFYDDMTEIGNFEVIVADGNGNKIKKFKQQDFDDFSISRTLFYNTERIIIINPAHNDFPYKLFVNYSYRTKSFFSFPIWNPKLFANLMVTKSSYSISAPKSYEINSGFKNLTVDYTKDSVDGIFNQTWTCNNLPLLLDEKVSTPSDWRVPLGYFSPHKFSYANVDGGFATWEEFGKWNYDICKTRKDLPKAELALLGEVTKNCKTKKDSIVALYEYLQESTRYVSITIEEGGFVPFDAEFVCTKKYGDCKALTNYMSAMLQAFGIESYYCIINAGLDAAPIDTSIIASQFNHVILMVPLKMDTLWLECTSNILPAGYLGNFTEDRYCLVTKADGSKLIKTPCSKAASNTIKTSGIATYSDTAFAYKSNVEKTGINAEGDIYMLQQLSKKEAAAKIISRLQFKLEDEKVSLHVSKEDVASTTEITGNVLAKNRVYGNKVFINQINNIQTFEIIDVSHKTYPFSIKQNQLISDETEYLFDDLAIESVPDSVTIKSIFGSYKMHIIKENNRVKISKELTLNKAIFKAELYNDYVNFLKLIKTSEEQLIILSSNE